GLNRGQGSHSYLHGQTPEGFVVGHCCTSSQRLRNAQWELRALRDGPWCGFFGWWAQNRRLASAIGCGTREAQGRVRRRRSRTVARAVLLGVRPGAVKKTPKKLGNGRDERS